MLCACMVQSAFCQLQIKGKVTDSVTGKPLSGVSIFFSQTSIGTVSDDQGDFTIENIPQGKYKIIVSSLNYLPFIGIIETNRLTGQFSVRLQPSVNVLKEVVVQAFDKDGWAKWGTYFTFYFIGASSLARHCKLMNPEVIKFSYSKKTKMLTAFADDKIIFENRELGYRIQYVLTRFAVDFTASVFEYAGYPLFEEMKADRPSTQLKWDSARIHIYKGSMLHFMRSLQSSRLKEEGFEIRLVNIVSDEEKIRVKKIYKLFQQMESSGIQARLAIDLDSLDYYTKVVKLSDDDNKVTLLRQLPESSLIFKTDFAPDARYFYYEGRLNIRYLHKKEPVEYTRISLKKPNKNYITSDIVFPFQRGVEVYQNGLFYNGEDLFNDGFWTWSEKLSTMLPSDYWPSGSK